MLLSKIKQLILPSKEKQFPEESAAKDIALKEKNINPKLHENIEILKSIYSYHKNQDVKIRNIYIDGINKKAALVFISTITDKNIIQEHIIEPLLQTTDTSGHINSIISGPSIDTEEKIKDILTNINKGNAALFVDGETKAYLISAADFQGRSIEQPQNEIVLKGPKEAFNESAYTNISLVRKKIKNENLIVESTTISERSKNDLYIVYVKDLANGEMLDNIKNRVNSLETDAIQDLALLEQYIEERKYSLFPTILYTERPDRAASFLEDGYIVLIMDNSPACLVLPATFWSFFHTSEDHYLRFIFGNFTRLIRIFAIFVTLFSSAAYVAVTNYHAEMIPPDLLLAIASTREKVPFPALIEVLLMEIAFELIREGGLRVPSAIGPTLGIVGALILGQAAVQANIVSPIVVIAVALGGLTSFAVGDISLNYTIRLSRFFFIFAAGFFGIYGMTAMFAVGLFYLLSIKSFGVPYLAPFTPKYTSSKDTIFRRLLNKEVFRPGYLKPKDIKKK